MTTRSSINLQRAALIIAMILFVLVAIFASSGCQSYQPPGQDLWKAL